VHSKLDQKMQDKKIEDPFTVLENRDQKFGESLVRTPSNTVSQTYEC